MKHVLITALAVLFLSATAAEAGVVAGAISAIGTWFSGLGVLGQLAVRLVAGLAISALSRLTARQPARQNQGITTEMTLAGGSNPDTMLVGYYATAGAWAGPWVMHGANNAYNSQVIDLSGVPSEALRQVYANGSPIVLGETPHADYGYPAENDYAGHLWIKFYDGSQTAADPFLLSAGGSDPDFPWTSDMVGRGRTYAIATYKFNREVWQGVPQFRFALDGARFYDMRKDSTAGGTGTHRLDDPASWEFTLNPVVMAAHLALGYELPDGNTYGGGYEIADLPLAVWAAAANKCDATFDNGSGPVPTFRAGYEISMDEEPMEIIGLLLATCDGEVADDAGTLLVKVGAPALPSAFITDDDILVSEAQDLDPFPGLAETINGVSITYPEPESGWESKEAPPRYNPTLEAEDGDRRLLTSLSLPACPYPDQVQRIGQAVVNDARRFRRHVVNLPPDLAWLSPLATISWTSDRNGYAGKVFEIQEKAVELRSYRAQMSLREVDPGDYDFDAVDLLPADTPSPVVTLPADVALNNFAATPIAITDADGINRRPGIRVSWSDAPSAGVDVEVRLAEDEISVSQVHVGDGTRGYVDVVEGLLPAQTYQVRGKIISDRPTVWSSWTSVTTGNYGLGHVDLSDVLSGQIFDTEALASDTRDIVDIHTVDLELRQTGEYDAADRLDRIAEALLNLQLLQRDTDARLSDAGIYIDPETGTVSIAAFQQVAERAADLRIDLNAANAQITSRVTYAEMNQALSELVLDPTQVPIIGDLQLRVTTVETDLDGLQGTVSTLATTTTVDGVNARLVTAEGKIDGLQGQIVNKVDVATFTPVETRLTTAENAISGIDGASIRQNVSDIRTVEDELDLSNMQTLGDLLTAYETREALRTDLAYVQEEIAAQVSEDRVAEAAARQALGVRIDGTATAIEAETLARASADGALAQDIVTLQSGLDTLDGAQSGTATALNSLTTRVSTAEGTISSQASALTSLSTTVGGHTTSISQQLTSINGIRGSWGVQINTDGVVTGAGLVSDIVDGEPVSEFTISANAFTVASPDASQTMSPFRVITTPTVINGVTVPPGVYGQSAMFHQGFFSSLSAVSANLGTFKTAETGERVEISDDVIKIYDASNVLRVQLGDLAA
ncbi:hypothetical protein EMVG_00019 [Emiliania huxleyi virus PS401]|nr:hypothetical protein EMVG_00019 [Emiliania huxleyi virus PS401]